MTTQNRRDADRETTPGPRESARDRRPAPDTTTPERSARVHDFSVSLSASPAALSRLDGALVRFYGGAGASDAAAWMSEASRGPAGELPYRAEMEQAYGQDLGGVKAYTGRRGAMDGLGAKAAAAGETVAFAESSPGKHVVAHEVAHVVQARLGGGTGVRGKSLSQPGDAAEVEADRAADAVLSGRRPEIRHGVDGGIFRFGATAKRKAELVNKGELDEHASERRDRDAICHENQTLGAAESAGMSDQEAQEIYSGNWQRDMNQLLLGGSTRPMNPAIFELLGILHLSHFGGGLTDETFKQGTNAEKAQERSGIPITQEEFGSYDPIEHIDNPAGLSGADVVNQTSGKGTETTRGATGSGDVGFANADPRYAKQHAAQKKKGATFANPEDYLAYQVDESGLPVYMQLSRKHMREMFGEASKGSGLEDSGTDRGRGARMAGEAMHILQDYFAHSNFCEIALNLLIREGAVSGAEGKTLDTQVHEQRVEVDEQGTITDYQQTPSKKNATVKGKGGAQREVMATGTFITEDTGHSVAAKVKGVLEAADPFKRKGHAPSPLMLAVADWADHHLSGSKGDFGGAARLVAQGLGELEALLRPVYEQSKPVVDSAKDAAASGIEGAADLGASALEGAGGLLGKVGVDAGALARDVRAGGKELGDDARELGDDAYAAAGEALKQMKALQESLKDDKHLLATLYAIAWDTMATFRISELLKGHPKLYKKARAREDAIREQVRAALESWWKGLVEQIQAFVDSTVEAVTDEDTKLHEQGQFGTWAKGVKDGDPVGATIKAGGRSKRYSAPTHTDIAKDFDPGQEDGDARKHGAERHQGAWLAKLADSLARKASNEAMALLQKAWHGPDAEAKKTARDALIARCDDRWFVHPADNRDFWQGPAAKFAKEAADEIRKHLR